MLEEQQTSTQGTKDVGPRTENNNPMSQVQGPSVDLMQEIKHAWNVFLLKEADIAVTAKKHEATLLGAAILCVPPILKIMIAFLVLQSFASPHYSSIFVNFIGGVLALFAPFYIARGWFKGQGDIEEFFRVATYARFPHVLTVVLAIAPAFFVFSLFLDFLIDLWMLWVIHILLMKMMKVEELDSFKVVGITFIGYLVIVGFLQLIF